MKRCSRMVDIGRRQFLRGMAVTAAAVPASSMVPGEAKAKAPPALLDYPSTRLANIADLKVNEALPVAYPDAEAPGVLLKLGRAVEGGSGPDRDVVGFSTVCPHKGFPLTYNAERRTLNCPGHYSVFDCEAGGLEVWGQATQNLPQYTLRIDDKGDIYAEAIDELLYGRLSNVL